MDRIHRPASPPDDGDDSEPVARWENEGGAYEERDLTVRASPGGVATPQDGDATRRE